jgi:hypothetical protein
MRRCAHWSQAIENLPERASVPGLQFCPDRRPLFQSWDSPAAHLGCSG